MRKILFYLSFCLLTSISRLYADTQGISVESISPYVSLHEMKTEHFTVIYPEAFIPHSKDFAKILEESYQKIRGLFPDAVIDEKSRWPIFINTFNITSNGYVTYSDKHSQFYASISPQAPELWLHKLAVHELTHVFQNELGKKRFLGALLYIFGQEGYSLLINSAIGNNWIWEGEAVTSETLFSNYGRGKDPRFDMELKALLLENDLKKFPDYYNHLASSSWNLYPDYYVYGYFLSIYLKKHYGNDIWTKLFTGSSSFPAFSFYATIRKITGKDIDVIYKEMLEDLKKQYINQTQGLKLNNISLITHSPKLGRNDYLLPKPLPKGHVLALRSTYGDFLSRTTYRKQVINISPNGDIKGLDEIKIDANTKIELGSNLLVWSVLESSPRWQSETYRNLYTYNLKTHLKKKLTRTGRFFSSAITPDDSTIAAASLNHSNEASIQIIDAKTGKIIKSFFEGQNEFYFDLHFNNDHELIYVKTLTKTGENQVETLDIDTGKVTPLFHNKDFNANPITFGKYVFYESSYSGIQNIYAYDLKEKAHYQVTSSIYGAFHPAADLSENKLYFNTYTSSHGQNIASTDIDKSKWTPKKKLVMRQLDYYKGIEIVSQKEASPIKKKKKEPANDPSKLYVDKNHSKISTFNFRGFSILPSSDLKDWRANLHFQDIYRLFSWNIYSSLKTDAAFGKTDGYDVGTSIETSLPYISLSASLTYTDLSYSLTKNNLGVKHKIIENFYSFSLPLNFYFDIFSYTLIPDVSLGLIFHQFDHPIIIDTQKTGFKVLRKNSNYSHLFFQQSYTLSQYFSLPNYQLSISPNYRNFINQSLHSFQIQVDNILTGFYGFDLFRLNFSYGFTDSPFFLPLTASTVNYDESLISNKMTLNVDYDIPILTRGHLGPILNFEDFTLTPFYQETFLLEKNYLSGKNLKSLGFDFVLHFKILNLSPAFVGLRYAYSFDKSNAKNFVGPIWGVSGLF